MSERYERQERIAGWDQKRLDEARVVVLGCGNVGSLVATGLAALGVGQIVLIDGARASDASWFRPFCPSSRRFRSEYLADFVSRVNPDSDPVVVRASPRHEGLEELIPEASYLVDASHDPRSLRLSHARGTALGVPVVAVRATFGRAFCGLTSEEQSSLGDVTRHVEPYIESMVAAALALDAVRRELVPLGDGATSGSRTLTYDRRRAERFLSCHEPNPTIPPPDGRERSHSGFPRRGLVVGAGGLGTSAGLALALAGWELTIVDPDSVEETNLNRQFLFFDSVGRPKATALAERLEALGTTPLVCGKVGRIEDDLIRAGQFDMIFACVDGFATRAHLNQVAKETATPLVNGGTGAMQGEVLVYAPGSTPCLDCQIAVSALAEEDRRTDSCARRPEPSTVIPNLLVGAQMAAEAEALLEPGLFGPPLEGALEFDALATPPCALRRVGRRCACHLGGP